MGVIVESCRSHMVCCNTEDRGLVTEPNINYKSMTFSDDENAINPTEISEMNKNIQI